MKRTGMANHEWNVPNTLDTKFRIGSVSKTFTAAGIVKLAEEGKLNLDDPISKHIGQLSGHLGQNYHQTFAGAYVGPS